MIPGAIQYTGEHLLWGALGQWAVNLSFIFSLLATIAYAVAVQKRNLPDIASSWKGLGRISFYIHGASVLAIIGILFHLMIQKYYEYAYVYDHSSDELPFRYVFSAFWGGQEGSFLLWAFWHVILGFVFIRMEKKWEAPVISIVSCVQFFITSMLLGIYLGSGPDAFKIGINPFVLLRDTIDAPIFQNADYLELIEGRGLNALLQNYWMTIHPPTLFLGFASTTIPFAFAFAGLWTKEYHAWLRPTLGWSTFSAAILGLGIWMGGAWAYEALTFGGYWAWDPVENMSLVPWLVLVAGLHAHLIAKSTGHSLRATFVFYLLSFVLIVYSTFLVRSGILEDTSVHAFVESGLEKQLLLFLLFFPLAGAALFAARYKSIPAPKKEEALSSREFWMFMGTLILTISSILITASTSLPVYNTIVELFDPLYEGKVIEDPVAHYNKHQIWIAIFIGFTSGLAQWLRYRERNFKSYAKTVGIQLGIAAILALVLSYISLTWLNAQAWQYQLMLFAGWFATISNSSYLIRSWKTNPKAISGILSHVGFGIMLVGILASGLNKEVISTNLFAQEGLLGMDRETLKSNIILLKNSPMDINGYRATYVDDTIVNRYRTYEILFEPQGDNEKEPFTLYPNIIYNKDYTKVEAYNPSTKRTLSYDVFTHISGLPQQESNFQMAKEFEDSLQYDKVSFNIRDTLTFGQYSIVPKLLTGTPRHEDYKYQDGDQTAGVELICMDGPFSQQDTIQTFLLLREGFLYQYAAYFPAARLKFKLPESFADQFFKPQGELDYDIYNMKMGSSLGWDQYTVTFEEIIRDPSSTQYNPEPGDIALAAHLLFEDANKNQFSLKPIYYIRGQVQDNIPDYNASAKTHSRFITVNPESSDFTIALAKEKVNKAETSVNSYELLVAKEVPRSDYIVLSATRFPGINLFWLGSVMMLSGLFVSMFLRWNKG